MIIKNTVFLANRLRACNAWARAQARNAGMLLSPKKIIVRPKNRKVREVLIAVKDLFALCKPTIKMYLLRFCFNN